MCLFDGITCFLYNTYTQDNEYVLAIKSVASVIAPYDSDQLIPVFGFGAKCPPRGEVSHCFPLTFNEQRMEVHGVQVGNSIIGCFNIYDCMYTLGNIGCVSICHWTSTTIWANKLFIYP